MGSAFIRTHLFWFINRNLIAFKDVVLTKMGVYLLGGLLVMYGHSSVAVLLTFMEYFSSMMDMVMSMMDQYMLLGEQEPSVRRRKQGQVCEKANLAEFIRTLPQGMDTLIGENGIKLSGGQRQRLVMARMFLHDPQVLILDEAFSGLDMENERQILGRMFKEAEDRIVIMITHRREALTGWDRILSLEL